MRIFQQGPDGPVTIYLADSLADMNAATITSIATVYTPPTGKKAILMGGAISVSAACSVLFEDNAAGKTLLRTPKLLADTPYTLDVDASGLPLAAVNNVVKATSSAAATITGFLKIALV